MEIKNIRLFSKNVVLFIFFSVLYVITNIKKEEIKMAGRKKKSEKSLETEICKNYENKVAEDTIAISQDLMKKILCDSDFYTWSNSQQKLLFSILGQIKWREGNNDTHLIFNNVELMNDLGWEIARTRSLRQMLVEDFRFIRKHSEVYIQDPYTGIWGSTGLIDSVAGDRGITHVVLNKTIMPHLENLFTYYKKTKQPFLLMMKKDVVKFSSGFSTPLYSLLLTEYNPHYHPNQRTIKLDKLREVFNLGDKYIRKAKDGTLTGIFDSYNFEKRVLLPAIEEINKTESICFMQFEDGSWFQKEKAGNRVVGYTFRYYVRDEKDITKRRKQKVIDAKAIKIKDNKIEAKGTV
jgi:hypothetical protein